MSLGVGTWEMIFAQCSSYESASCSKLGSEPAKECPCCQLSYIASHKIQPVLGAAAGHE